MDECILHTHTRSTNMDVQFKMFKNTVKASVLIVAYSYSIEILSLKDLFQQGHHHHH